MKFEDISFFDFFPDERRGRRKRRQIKSDSRVQSIEHRNWPWHCALSEIILLSVRPVQMLNRPRCNLSARRIGAFFWIKRRLFLNSTLLWGSCSSLWVSKESKKGDARTHKKTNEIQHECNPLSRADKKFWLCTGKRQCAHSRISHNDNLFEGAPGSADK